MDAYIAGIIYGSMVDGDGLRTVVFFSGCSMRCKYCHNWKYRDKYSGQKIDVCELFHSIEAKTPQKRITFSGGEPLEQVDALSKLINLCSGFDIGLYTGYEFEKVPSYILQKLNFIKTGKFIEELKIYGEYYGSSNQRMIYLK